MPRPNLYQSLHTTVIHSGQTFEVADSHKRNASHRGQGVAAHWRYKDGKDVSDADDQRILWDEAINRMGKGNARAVGIYVHAQGDLYPEEVYGVPPRKEGARAPRAGATPVDFAYDRSHGSGQSVHRRKGERPDRSASCKKPPHEWRCRRDSYAEGPRPQPGLAELCAHFTRAEQGPPSHQLHRAKPGDGSRPPLARAGKRGKRGAV